MNRIFVSLLTLILAVPAFGAPPVVVSASPDNGEVGVDPGTSEIVIAWSKVMTMAGEIFEGVGIAPDAAVEWATETHPKRDPVLEEAVRVLRE